MLFAIAQQDVCIKSAADALGEKLPVRYFSSRCILSGSVLLPEKDHGRHFFFLAFF